ncbi:hypothetical protein [Shewanella sp. S1-58-MNA-CIBAN-0166]|uniref:hypothetical protein n=1 Tax=Shewanella sp. S1-58-MNA-CIBAN-0166 TaxID=3140467 RepID=UPI00331E3767
MINDQQDNTKKFSGFRIVNKLGGSFFILFLIGAFLPLVAAGGWSQEKISLYEYDQPLLLMFIALIGIIVYLSGISRLFARVISSVFIAVVILTILSNAYDIYEAAKILRANEFRVSYLVRSISEALAPYSFVTKQDLGSKFQYTLSIGAVILTLSFVGITGCIFSPRYKENKELQEKIVEENINSSVSHTWKETETGNIDSLTTEKMLTNSLMAKLISFVKHIYSIVAPVINTLLDKCSNLICDKIPTLKPNQQKVKFGVGCILIILIYIIIF